MNRVSHAVPADRRAILHVDMDSFYASCELKKYPEMKNKPFIVGADPRNGDGRGVVLACNYEAKKLGLHSAMPIATAWKLCPDGFYVRPNFEFYGSVSKSVIEAIRQFSDVMEQVSIDEAYLDVTNKVYRQIDSTEEPRWPIEEIKNHAMKIKGKVFETEQITCSIGASNSKIVSKIATDFNKPDGLTIIEPERVVEFLSPLSVGKIPGIGKKTQKVLEEKFGIKTISDLSRADLQALRDRFGRSALWMKLVAEGREYSSVTEGWEPVSISSETTFETDELEFQKIVDTLREIAIDVVNRANEDGYFFSNVGIKIRFTGFDTHTRSKELPTSTNSLQTVVVECEKMLAEFRGSKKGVRLIGVKLSSLKHMDKGEQSTLLDFGASNI